MTARAAQCDVLEHQIAWVDQVQHLGRARLEDHVALPDDRDGAARLALDIGEEAALVGPRADEDPGAGSRRVERFGERPEGKRLGPIARGSLGHVERALVGDAAIEGSRQYARDASIGNGDVVARIEARVDARVVTRVVTRIFARGVLGAVPARVARARVGHVIVATSNAEDDER